MMDEDQLVAALKSGNTAAGEDLVHLYGDRLLRSAYLLCGNESDAQDLVQDTLILAIKAAWRFRGKSALYTWLHGILINQTRRYHRKRKRLVYTDALPEQRTADSPDSDNPDMRAASSVLANALQRLTPPHREVIVLRYYEGMKIEEIAKHTGVTKGTVKSRLHYATSRLRDLIPAELNLFGPAGTYERRKP